MGPRRKPRTKYACIATARPADGIATSLYVANKLCTELYIGPANVNKESYLNDILF